MEFYERLCFILDEKGISNSMLWRRTNKNPATISNYRTGKTFPDAKFLIVLREFLPQYNSNWLLFEEGQPFLNNENTDDNSNSFKEKKAEIMDGKQKEVLQAKLAVLENAVTTINEQFSEVKQLAMIGLEKLKGVARVRLICYLNRFVNTQNLLLCK